MSPYNFLDSLVFLPVLLIMRIMQFGITNVVWLRHRRTGHKMFPNILQMSCLEWFEMVMIRSAFFMSLRDFLRASK